MFKVIFLLTCALALVNSYEFPSEFSFGVASASYQVEGGWDANGKGENIWDRLTHWHPDWIGGMANGDIACDSYNKWAQDVQICADLGVNFYRFSLSWSRILPTGHVNSINPDGIRYYNDLINGLLANGVQPYVTIYHWDLPQPLQDLGGWTNPLMAQYFEDFADVVFSNFGDRVKFWITFNEPLEVCKTGYGEGVFAPAWRASGIGDYQCGKTLLLAHARAYHLYQDKYAAAQQGKVGITISASWSEPGSDSPEDIEAAERKLNMEFGWWANPIFSETGNYPQVQISSIDEMSAAEGYPRSRLPALSPEEIEYIRGTSDFFGLNHYSSLMVVNGGPPVTEPTSFWKDMRIDAWQDPSWGESAVGWLKVVPWGFRKLLNWIKNTYNNPPVIVTENGFADVGELEDLGRIDYYRQYLLALLEAIHEDGCNIQGYTAWSIMDNFEWRDGYTVKFGLVQVNFDDPERTRTPKASYDFFKSIIANRVVPETFNRTKIVNKRV